MFKSIMKLHALLFAALLAIIPATLAQGPNITFLSGLFQTLESRNSSSFTSIVQSINNSGVGQFLLANISNGEPHLLFIPNNEACKPRSACVLLSMMFPSRLLMGASIQCQMHPRTSLRTLICSPTYSDIISSLEILVARSQRFLTIPLVGLF